MNLIKKIMLGALPLLIVIQAAKAENIIRTVAPIKHQVADASPPSPVSGYRYWRLFILANNGDSYHSIGELELRAQPGGLDLTSPSTPTVHSSMYADAYNGSKTVDNDPQFWISDTTPGPQWLEFDLINPVEVKEIAMHPSPQTSVNQARAPRDFRVEASTDKQSWVVIKEYQGTTAWGISGWHIFPL